MPLDFIVRLLLGLPTLALLDAGGYIFYKWHIGELLSGSWLILSLATLLWSVLGFLPILLLHRPGQDEPKPNRSGRVHHLSRPDGSEIQVEIYGPDDAPTLILTRLGT